METITLHCPPCGSKALCVMGMPSTGNRNMTVMPVGVAAVKTLPPMPIQKLVARKFCMPKDASSGGLCDLTFGYKGCGEEGKVIG
jgi:hypothetical protein